MTGLLSFQRLLRGRLPKGEILSVYEDFNRHGTSYTLEQAEVYVKTVESFLEEMKSSENAKSVLQDFEKKHIFVGFDVKRYVL